MPALRGVSTMAPRTRRRSSVFAPAKAGVYTSHPLSHLPPRPISFAPNVTPITFTASSSDDEGAGDLSDSNTPPLSPGGSSTLGSFPHGSNASANSAQGKLFPPSSDPPPAPIRKRCPPGKRRSQGYIPRPPNAFMLFRADFVRQKHVPGSIETNHGSLSKIIGNCWRSLPLDEKKVWETKAKHEKAAHKIAYPHYRFKPVHNKGKRGVGAAATSTTGTKSTSSSNTTKKPAQAPQDTFEEEMRCEEVTQLLLQGLKGEELSRALRELEGRRRDVQERERMQLELDSPEQPQYEEGMGGQGPLVYGQDVFSPDALYASEYALAPQDAYGASDPYGQQELGGAGGGGYAEYGQGSRGATPSTASSAFTGMSGGGMSAPQPTYPVFGFGATGGFGGGFGGWNPMAQQQTQQPMFMQRRPSSVPAIPTSFGMGMGGWDYVMQDDSVLPPASSYEQRQGAQAQQQQQQQEGNGIEIPTVPFLPPPSSAGPVPAISGHVSSASSQFPLSSASTNPLSSSTSSQFPPSSTSSNFGPASNLMTTNTLAAPSTSDVYGHRLSMSLSQRMALGHRRSSSAGAAFGGIRGQSMGMWGAGMGMGTWGWGVAPGENAEESGVAGMNGGQGAFSWPPPQEIQRDDSELPEADLSLFNPSFLGAALGGGARAEDVGPPTVSVGSSGGEGVDLGVGAGQAQVQHQGRGQQCGGVMGGGGEQGTTPSPQHPFTTDELYQHLPGHQHHQLHQQQRELGPLETGPSEGGHGHSHSSAHSHRGHSAHASVDVPLNALQFQPGDAAAMTQVQQSRGQIQVQNLQGQQGQREPSPVEQYEQMYLAERGQYGGEGGSYGGEYGIGYEY